MTLKPVSKQMLTDVREQVRAHFVRCFQTNEEQYRSLKNLSLGNILLMFVGVRYWEHTDG